MATDLQTEPLERVSPANRGFGAIPCLYCPETEDVVSLNPETMTFKCSSCEAEWLPNEVAERLETLRKPWAKMLTWVALLPDAE